MYKNLHNRRGCGKGLFPRIHTRFPLLLGRKREERTRSVKVDLQYTYLLTYFSQGVRLDQRLQKIESVLIYIYIKYI